MTNREKLREVFPRTIFIYEKKADKTCAIMCSDEWLDAEYDEGEVWNGIHAQITAPKGTFEKIWREAKDDDFDV